MTEKEKMLLEKIYDSTDAELVSIRSNAHRLSQLYNATFEDEVQKRKEILDELLPQRGVGAFFQGPIYFDYGLFTKVGKNFYANFNLTVLDCAFVEIGDDVMIGPNCSILTPTHPLRYQERNIRLKADGTPYDYEYAKSITIGSNCWIAGNVTIIGGVHIEDGCVIGAGSVVTKDIPQNSLAVGNPCKVIRKITETDSILENDDLFSN